MKLQQMFYKIFQGSKINNNKSTMKFKLKEIAELVDGKIVGNENLEVVSINTLQDAKENEMTFFGNMKYEHLVKDTKACVIIIPEGIDYTKYGNKTFLLVKDPQAAYGKFLIKLNELKSSNKKASISSKATIDKTVKLGTNLFIGPNVVIEQNTSIGDDTKIKANVYIGENVKIGKNCLIYPNVTIREDTVIGDNCILNPGVVLGGDGFGFIPEGEKIIKKPQLGYVELGNNVEVGSNTTIDRAALPSSKTYIGDNTKIDNLVMIAHNVQIGKNTMIVAQVGVAGSTTIGNHVTIGGQVGIVGHVKIADNVMLGAKTGISNNVEPNQILSGDPCQPYRRHLQTKAIIKKLPEIYAQIKELLKEKKDN